MLLSDVQKKPNIPPRPKAPVAEQVLDDLKNAPEDDVVFMLMKNSTSDYLKSSPNTSGAVSDIPASHIVSENINAVEAEYQKLRSFLRVNTSLQTMLQKLRSQNDSLITSGTELRKMAEHIRKQASDALK